MTMYYIIAQELSSKFMHGSSVQISYRSDCIQVGFLTDSLERRTTKQASTSTNRTEQNRTEHNHSFVLIQLYKCLPFRRIVTTIPTEHLHIHDIQYTYITVLILMLLHVIHFIRLFMDINKSINQQINIYS